MRFVDPAMTELPQDFIRTSTPVTAPPVSEVDHPGDATHDGVKPRPAHHQSHEASPVLHGQDSSPVPSRPTRCLVSCAFGAATELHHHRLMAIEEDPDVLLELMELAVTWPELEYSETQTIPPNRWMILVRSHQWADPDRVERIFSVATDIAMTATRASKQPRTA